MLWVTLLCGFGFTLLVVRYDMYEREPWYLLSLALLLGGGAYLGLSYGEDFLLAMLDQDPGARSLGEIAIGTNYAITDYSKNTLFDEKIGGTFHAAVGAGYPETGNDNQSGLHWDMVCDLRTGGTITVDGEVISRDGKFVFDGWPGN